MCLTFTTLVPQRKKTMARSEAFDDLATEADDVADDPFVDDVVVLS